MTRGLRIVVVGNGPAGNWSAARAQALDPTCQVVLLSAEDLASYSPCALPQYITGRLDRSRLFVRFPGVSARDGFSFRPGSRIEGVDLTAQRIFRERQAGSRGDDAIAYDRLILAIGADAVLPPVEGATLTGCFTAKSLHDADGIVAWRPREVAVIGAGPIGLEMAALLHEAGCRIHLFEIAPGAAPATLNEPIAGRVGSHLRDQGIDLHLGARVRRILGRDSRVAAVGTDSGVIPCDTVIWATGVRPRTQAVAAAGIATGLQGGILVDDRMQTSAPDVFACGDCAEAGDALTGRPELVMLWGNAVQQGIVAGANAVGHPGRYGGPVRLVSLDLLGLRVCAAGLGGTGAATLPDLRLQTVDWRGATYGVLTSADRLIGIQAVGREIDPTPVRDFLTGSLGKAQGEDALESNNRRLWPRALVDSRSRAFMDAWRLGRV